jgi:hypothetical protein
VLQDLIDQVYEKIAMRHNRFALKKGRKVLVEEASIETVEAAWIETRRSFKWAQEGLQRKAGSIISWNFRLLQI